MLPRERGRPPTWTGAMRQKDEGRSAYTERERATGPPEWVLHTLRRLGHRAHRPRDLFTHRPGGLFLRIGQSPHLRRRVIGGSGPGICPVSGPIGLGLCRIPDMTFTEFHTSRHFGE
jgi:hypothetical protein